MRATQEGRCHVSVFGFTTQAKKSQTGRKNLFLKNKKLKWKIFSYFWLDTKEKKMKGTSIKSFTALILCILIYVCKLIMVKTVK